MSNLSLPHGLRHVLVHVTLGSDFPPAANSTSDIALLRSANRAMQRKVQGVEDAFLFVVAGRHPSEKVAEAIAAYGFPQACVVCVNVQDDDEAHGQEISDETFFAVGHVVEQWLNRDHAGAVARFCQDYPDTEFWWSGVEYVAPVFDWPFSDADFASALPTTHYSRAATWLAILGHAVYLEEIQSSRPCALAGDRAVAWAATLCEWLHGFEAASGNDGNHLASELSAALMPSDFFLGFELARLSGDDLEFACDAADADVDSMLVFALKAITADKRSELRDALSDFFGGDSALFWALYSAIWPNFDKAMSDALDEKIGSDDYEDLAELDAPWRYVSDGWGDEADD